MEELEGVWEIEPRNILNSEKNTSLEGVFAHQHVHRTIHDAAKGIHFYSASTPG